MAHRSHSALAPVALALLALAARAADDGGRDGPFSDYRLQAPGKVHRIGVEDLPPPYATASATKPPAIVPRPRGAWPVAPPGFKVERYASGLQQPRVLRTAPNGDLFVAESAAGRIRVLRGTRSTPGRIELFAQGLNLPYGIAFYPPGPHPQWLYVGQPGSVVRFAYRNGQLHAGGPPRHVADLPQAGGGHQTRDLQFSRDGSTLYAAVGSASNVDDPDSTPDEAQRADILAFDPDGSNRHVYASGIRNPSGLAVNPADGQLWCIVNERDGLGDDLVPDYITHVQPGGFYGWPWWYIGAHQDPRHPGKHPELAHAAIVPDVLVQPHNGSLQIAFYQGSQFPAQYRGSLFATAHGSWNRSVRTGYEVIRVPLDEAGRASGEYQDFVTGFVVDDDRVWGRPVGIAEAPDGSLMISDDASGSIWRVRYTGR